MLSALQRVFSPSRRYLRLRLFRGVTLLDRLIPADVFDQLRYTRELFLLRFLVGTSLTVSFLMSAMGLYVQFFQSWRAIHPLEEVALDVLPLAPLLVLKVTRKPVLARNFAAILFCVLYLFIIWEYGGNHHTTLIWAPFIPFAGWLLGGLRIGILCAVLVGAGSVAVNLAFPMQLHFERPSGAPDFVSFVPDLIATTILSVGLLTLFDLLKRMSDRSLATESRLLQEQQAKMVAASKFSALGEMAGGMAHEINNPLAIIGLSATQLRRMLERGEVDREAALIKLARIEDTVGRISRIIKGLSVLSRSSERDLFRQVSANQLIENTLGFCSEKFRVNGVELRVVLLPTDATLECRETQVCQVLLNLLNNAYDAVVDRSESWVEIRGSATGTHVILEVIDSGPGIPAELRDKITQPFFTTKEVGKGTGLGLSISVGIVKQHGGTLELDPEFPRTRFVVRLPRKQAEIH